jgi:hypothetical protein
MDPLTMALLMGGISALGTGGSLFGSWKANKKSQDILNQEKNDLYKDKAKLEEWKTKNSTNYMDTPEAQTMISQLLENSKENNDTIASNSAITGATNANVTAQKKASQYNIVDALRKMAQYGTQWRNGIDSTYFNQSNGLAGRKLGLQNDQINIEEQKSKQWSQFMQSLTGATTSIGMAYGMGSGTTGDTPLPYGNEANYKWASGN